MESFITLVEFAKANGIVASIPVMGVVIFKVVRENNAEAAVDREKNQDAIRAAEEANHALELRIVSMEATIEAIVSKYY